MAEGCLLIVDVQKGFINRWTGHIPARVETLQDQYRRIIATRFLNPPGSLYRRLIGWHRFAPGSKDVELAFTPRPDARVIDKTAYSCVTGDFVNQLKQNRVATVHLCGIATDSCVLKCAVDLFEAGIEPVVLADCCASHGGPQCHQAGLMLLRRLIGEGQVVVGGAATS